MVSIAASQQEELCVSETGLTTFCVECTFLPGALASSHSPSTGFLGYVVILNWL